MNVVGVKIRIGYIFGKKMKVKRYVGRNVIKNVYKFWFYLIEFLLRVRENLKKYRNYNKLRVWVFKIKKIFIIKYDVWKLILLWRSDFVNIW